MPLVVVAVSIRYDSQAEAGVIQHDAVAPEAHAHVPVALSNLAGVGVRYNPTHVPLAREVHDPSPYGRSPVGIAAELPDGAPGAHNSSYEVDEHVR